MITQRAFNHFAGTGIGSIPGGMRIYETILRFTNTPTQVHEAVFYPVVTPDGIVFYHPGYEHEILSEFLEDAAHSDVILDIGAALGLYSITAGIHTDSAIHAFEPGRDRYGGLLRNMKENEVTVTPHRVIIGDTDTIAYTTETGAIDPVPVRCLDSLELAPNLVKIDVEGFEHAVLRGGRETIREHRPIIYIEVHGDRLRSHNTTDGEFRDFIEETFGYDVGDISPRGAPGTYWRCVPREVAS